MAPEFTQQRLSCSGLHGTPVVICHLSCMGFDTNCCSVAHSCLTLCNPMNLRPLLATIG